MANLIIGQSPTLFGELWLTDKNGVPLQDLTSYLVSGFVDWHGDRSDGTPMTCEFVLNKPGLVTPWTDFITPYINITYKDDTPSVRERMGIFNVTPYGEDHTATTAESTITGRDLTYLLTTASYLDTQNYAVGTNVVTTMRSIIASVGITRYNIHSSTRTMGFARTYTAGQNKREAVNSLANSIGYYKPFMDRSGTIRSSPYIKLSTTQPSKIYTEANIIETLTLTAPPTDEFANVVVLKKDNGEDDPYISVARQDDPAVPWSTVALGRTFVRPLETVSDADTQADLDRIAQERLDNAGAYEKVIQLKTMPDPYQEINRCVDLLLTGEKAYLNGRYRLRGWRVGFTQDDAAVAVEMHRLALFTGGLVPGQGLAPI